MASGGVADEDVYYKCFKGLHLITQKAIPCVDNCLKVWHANQAILPCTTGNCPKGKKPKQPTSCQNCIDWGYAIEGSVYHPPQQKASRPHLKGQQLPSLQGPQPPPGPRHTGPKQAQVTWMNVSSSDFSKSHVEIAKAFVLRLPSKQQTQGVAKQPYASIADFDMASILMIMARFRHFHGADFNSYETVQKVADMRNEMSHMGLGKDMYIEDKTANEYFKNLDALAMCLEKLHPQHFPAAVDIQTQLKKIQSAPMTSAMKHELKSLIRQEMQPIVDEIKDMSTKVNQIDKSTKHIQADINEMKKTTDETQKDVQSLAKRTEGQLSDIKGSIAELKAGVADQQSCGATDETISISSKMSVKELKGLASKLQVDITGCLEKSELVAALRNAQQQNTQDMVSGGQTNIDVQTDISGSSFQDQSSTQGTSQSDAKQSFDLKKCQEELKEFYLSEMGKVNLLPWVPDAVEDMENIFVDLELIKQESFRSSSSEVKKLDSNEDLVTLKQGQGQSVNRVLVTGDAGSGKSTMAANIAHKWANLKADSQSPLSKFTLVFTISLHEIQDSNDSLVDLIFQLILPEDSQVSKEGLRSYITSNSKDVLLLIDGMDEDSAGILKVRSNEITKVLHNRKLRNCCVILTTRPHRKDDLGDHLRHYTQVKLTGFSLENIFKYVSNFFRDDTEKTDSLIQKLKQEPLLLALAAVPVLLLMLCLLWLDQCSLPYTKTQLYKNTLTHMWKRYRSKERQTCPLDEESNDEEMPDEMKTLLYKMGKVVLNGIDPENEQVVFSEKDFGSEVYNLGCKVGIITRERLRSKCTVKASVTFLHKSFQDFCAGMYLAKLLDTNRSDADKYLNRMYRIDRSGIHFYSPLVLDFCCGIQPHLSHILLELTIRQSHIRTCLPQESCVNISSHLSHIFESQLTYGDLVSLFSGVSNNLKLTVSYGRIPYVLYLLKLSSEAENGHEGFILAKLADLEINHGYEPWLPSAFKFTPNVVTLQIYMGLNIVNIAPSYLRELYFAISRLNKLKMLALGNFKTYTHLKLDITCLLDILTKNKNINLNRLILNGCQFDKKIMATFLTNCTSLTQLGLSGFQNPILPNQMTAIKEVITVIPNLRKLEALQIFDYKIGSAVKYLKSVVPHLQALELSSCHLSEQNLKELFTQVLKRAQKLEVLNLSENMLTLSSVESLVECLQRIPCLELLYLNDTGLNDESVCVLASGLKKIKSPLRKVYLQMNSYSQIGREALEGLPVDDDDAALRLKDIMGMVPIFR